MTSPSEFPDAPDGYSARAMAGMVREWGLEPLIRHYIASDAIADPELAKWWNAAEHALDQITRILDQA